MPDSDRRLEGPQLLEISQARGLPTRRRAVALGLGVATLLVVVFFLVIRVMGLLGRFTTVQRDSAGVVLFLLCVLAYRSTRNRVLRANGIDTRERLYGRAGQTTLKFLTLCAGLVAFVAVGALFSRIDEALWGPSDNITGVILVHFPFGGAGPWDRCDGGAHRPNVRDGAYIELADGQGEPIAGTTIRNLTSKDLDMLVELNDATGLLEKGAAPNTVRSFPADYEGWACFFVFEFGGVHRQEEYAFEVAHQHGAPALSLQQLQDDQFYVRLTIASR